MKVLVACEWSGFVRDAFIKRGYDAMSCDLIPTKRPGPHYTGDMFDLDLTQFDLVIAHPPCTYIAISGNGTYAGTEKRKKGVAFIERIWNIPVKYLVIENPVGVINTSLPYMPKPQYIQPWQFGHPETKKTGLWKRNLPDLVPTNIVNGREQRIKNLPDSKGRKRKREKTYAGIAHAIAEQWGKYVEEELSRSD